MANDKDLRDLFHETLKDIYFTEKKILSPADGESGAVRGPQGCIPEARDRPPPNAGMLSGPALIAGRLRLLAQEGSPRNRKISTMFKLGQSGNPGGRPKSATAIRSRALERCSI
jgi:hypothetical protein